ncbi:MAG: AAA family ATPase [Actinomycetia bacterium]|nr:AAA family ATPase [Actinomycetes bacterium]
MSRGVESGEAGPVPVLIGRQPEFDHLRAVADLAVEHGVQMVLVSGEAGIGKTTLTSGFLHQLTESGWSGHIGRCIDYADRTMPFGPVISILRSVLLSDLEDIDELVGHHRRDLAALLPELADEINEVASLDGDVDRLFGAIAATLHASALKRPLAIRIEDIHWSDAATRDLLTSLVHTLGRARVLLVVTERFGATDRNHPVRTWMAESRRLPNVHSMELEGLSRDELETQAGQVLGGTPDPDLVDELVERTRGNPYFAHELLVARRDGSLELPVSLIEFLSSRVSRLTDDERELLRALAVVGGGADHRLLSAMLPDLEVGPLQRALFDTSILTIEGSAITFGHALLREAILSDVLPFEAEELHRRAAEAIVDDPSRGESLSDLTSLALHWAAAQDPDRSLTAAIRAATSAAAVAAYAAAADMSRQALWAWPGASNPEERTGMSRDQLLAQAVDWLASCYRGAEAVEAIREALAGWARELPASQRALLLARMAPIQWHLGNPPETARLLDEAKLLVGDEVSPEAAQIHHRISKQALANGQIHPALEAAERAIAIAKSQGPLVVLIEATTTKALATGVTLDLDAGVALARTARKMALEHKLVSQVANTFRTEMLIVAFRAGRTEACIEASRQGLGYAELHCGPRWQSEFRLDLFLSLVEAGRVHEAGPLQEILLGSELDDLRRLTVVQASALHALAVDDLDQAQTFLDEATEVAGRYQSAQETGFQSRLQAELARRRGQLDEALELVDEALELQLVEDNVMFTRESIIEKLRIVRACRTAGRPDLDELILQVTQLADDFDGEGLANEAMRALMGLELGAINGNLDRDAGHRAVAMLEESGALHESAQARLLLIEDLVATDVDPEEVQAQAQALHKLATENGMVWVLGQLTATTGEAQAPGKAPAPTADPAELPHRLTTREVEVMSLLAEGLTNKGIGERLFVSPRTVGTHISNLLAKLGVTTRGEAAAAYHRLGLAEVIDLRDADTPAPTS